LGLPRVQNLGAPNGIGWAFSTERGQGILPSFNGGWYRNFWGGKAFLEGGDLFHFGRLG